MGYHQHIAAAVLLLLLLSGWAGCKRDQPQQQGKWASCTCPYLTDYDQVATHNLEVCVPEGVKPEQAAYNCAGKLTHGPAEPCTCKEPSGACDGKMTCKSNEYK